MAAESTGILGLLGSSKGELGGSEESDDPSQEAANDAAEAFFGAGKRGDWTGAVAAYKDLKKACEALTSTEETGADEEY